MPLEKRFSPGADAADAADAEGAAGPGATRGPQFSA